MALKPEEMIIHEYSGRKYRIIDFEGYVLWLRRGDGLYAVDPTALEEFKNCIRNWQQIA
ncbi:hypothetical protein SPSIL_020110 [Sporomusa silvacetica DSM 10669]|uniref:Uncharacterized protein n=1 Tax=Sporomusa silvacetica DSM 10669 TaxID=1123289 RepID=A0ABZ3IKC0_9FIRM|nr:hypothetical protein [Sporomusa silvacetica]OZC18736.1 hypothetical protein SPSIL_23450 [Sporomusa silvacetica DSM 10669]